MVTKEQIEKYYEFQFAILEKHETEIAKRISEARRLSFEQPENGAVKQKLRNLEQDAAGMRESRDFLTNTKASFRPAKENGKYYHMYINPDLQSPEVIASCMRLVNGIQSMEAIKFVRPAKQATPTMIKATI